MPHWMMAARCGLALLASLGMLLRGNYPMALVFFAFALADVGLLWATRR